MRQERIDWCPMKFSSANREDDGNSCDGENCAWFVKWEDGEGYCAIKALPFVISELKNTMVVKTI